MPNLPRYLTEVFKENIFAVWVCFPRGELERCGLRKKKIPFSHSDGNNDSRLLRWSLAVGAGSTVGRVCRLPGEHARQRAAVVVEGRQPRKPRCSGYHGNPEVEPEAVIYMEGGEAWLLGLAALHNEIGESAWPARRRPHSLERNASQLSDVCPQTACRLIFTLF